MASKSVIARLRFTVGDDLTLLHAVVDFNPYEDNRRWENVRENVTRESLKNFSLRAIREHVEHLIKLYMKQDRGNLKKSGTEEQYQAKEKLLQQILDLKKEFDTPKNKKLTRVHGVSNGVVEDSTASCSYDECVQENVYYEDTYEDNVDDLIKVEETEEAEYTDREGNCENKRVRLESHNLMFGTNSYGTFSRKSNHEVLSEPDLQSLKEKIRLKELALEERKLAIEERKIRLEESKFELEKSEKERRLQIELEERRHRLQLDKQQGEINKLLIEYLINKKE